MKAFILLGCLAVLAGCHDTTSVPRSSTPTTSNTNVHVPSASEISQGKEAEFARKLTELQAKNPVVDAQVAIAQGQHYFLGGAGRSTTVPGIQPEIYSVLRNKCPMQHLDGVSDALYGPNHAHYVSAALAYSEKWNKEMLRACQ